MILSILFLNLFFFVVAQNQLLAIPRKIDVWSQESAGDSSHAKRTDQMG